MSVTMSNTPLPQTDKNSKVRLSVMARLAPGGNVDANSIAGCNISHSFLLSGDCNLRLLPRAVVLNLPNAATL